MLETEFYPATEKSSRLLVALHGLGDSVAGYRWLPHEMRLPWMNFLLVNAPDPYYGGFSWYDFAGQPGPGIDRSRRELFSLLDQLPARGFPIDQVTLFGFSQGCLMTIEIAARYPHRLAGAVGVSGYVHEVERMALEFSPAAREQRLLVTHGTQDPLVPLAPVREQIQFLQRAGLQVEWREFVKAHTIAGEQELDAIRKFVVAGYP